MSPDRRITWYEKQKQRKASPFFRLIDRSFEFRLFVASIIAFLLLNAVHRFEVCGVGDYLTDCHLTDFWSVISVGNVEAFSIVTASLIYILESGRRKQHEHLADMETIMALQKAGAVNSIGRIRALENLSEAGLCLDGIDLHGINLEDLEVPYGRLRGVNLENAVLNGADFRYADLTKANLRNANLAGTNLTGANLTDADLTGANLTNANLTDTDLTRTKLDGDIPNGK
ncbi:MAG: pentapeptide repeat-containing protein [Pseudanabaena sp.]|nr:MAG: pentapeptide repeat-containing protein [Pseudanabaena sp.]